MSTSQRSKCVHGTWRDLCPTCGEPRSELAPVAGSAITLHAEYDAYEGWRVIYRHRNDIKPVPGSGCRINIVPDDNGPYFTTVARCPTEEWAKRIVAALADSPNTKLGDAP